METGQQEAVSPLSLLSLPFYSHLYTLSSSSIFPSSLPISSAPPPFFLHPQEFRSKGRTVTTSKNSSCQKGGTEDNMVGGSSDYRKLSQVIFGECPIKLEPPRSGGGKLGTPFPSQPRLFNVTSVSSESPQSPRCSLQSPRQLLEEDSLRGH